MKERPILFSAPMVLALLAGTKTQTRRLIKPQPMVRPIGWGTFDDNPRMRTLSCPYGQPGDRLWVREAWAVPFQFNDRAPFDLPGGVTQKMYFRADGDPSHAGNAGKWRPSIHMPRWASRISLEVTNVRVERLQDISESDAVAEGVNHVSYRTAVEAYSDLWESINGDGSLALNPWVWVVEFRRAER